MEINYMLSYGAAGPSILLLMKFNLLQPLLPFQAAYLQKASKASPLSSTMLMRLFSNMDKLVFCDQPADCRLWIALLAFHTALVRDPQDALVVSAFGSVLYLGHWKEAVRYARKHQKSLAKFAPEVSELSGNMSDEDLAEAVAQFTFLLQDSVNVLTEMEDLKEALSLYSDSKPSGRVFVPKKKAREVAGAFDDLVNNIESYESKMEGSINYVSLGKGDLCQIRFVLGKIILDTITENVIEQADLDGKKRLTKTQHAPDATSGNDSSTLSNQFKNRDESRVQKHREHDPEASVPKSRQMTSSKRPRPDDSTAKIHRVSATDKGNDDSTLPNPGNNHHQSRVQKDTKQGAEAAVPEPKQKTSSRRRLKLEEGKINQKPLASAVSDLLEVVKKVEDNVVSDDSPGKLLNKLVRRSDTKTKETINEETSSKPKEGKSGPSAKTKKRHSNRKLSSLFK